MFARSIVSITGGAVGGRSFSTGMTSFKNIAVVLSGCGVYDGTEVHEAASCMASITRNNFTPVIYAPDRPQAHVINHQNGEEMSGQRHIMIESARIARGAVKRLDELTADGDIAGVVFPGGFGAAKNLCDFGFKGLEMVADKEVERVLTEFQKAGKPIALCCIAPILAAKVFGSRGVTLTLGKRGSGDLWPYGDAVTAAASFGAKIVEVEVNEVVVDKELKIVTTPAFMYNGKFHEIQDGVKNMVDAMIQLM